MTPQIVKDQKVEGQFVLKGVRLAFTNDLNVARAPQAGNSKPKWGCTVLIPEGSEVLKEIQAIMQQLAQKAFGQQAAAVWAEMKAGNKLALKDGALKASTAGFAGHWFMSPSAKEESPPILLSKFNDPATGKPQVLQRPQNVIYSGCYGNVQIALWAQNNQYGKRINSDLKVVQFAGDGESFGGGAAGANLDAFGGEDAPSAFSAPAPGNMGAFAPGGFDL